MLNPVARRRGQSGKNRKGRMTQSQEHVDVAAKIRRWCRKENPNITFGFYHDGSTHSLQEMDNDNINLDDMLRCLRGCRVSDVRLENGEWRYRAEGKDKDGRDLVFIVVLYDESEEVKVVTAWAVK